VSPLPGHAAAKKHSFRYHAKAETSR